VSSLREELDDLGGDVTTALEDISVAAALLDPDGVIRWQNSAGRELRGDLVGRRADELVAESDLDKLHGVLEAIFCRGEPAEFTVRVLDPSGTYVPIDFSSAPVKDGSAVVGVFGLGRTAEDPPAPKAKPAEEVPLTPRQLEVLQLLAQGKSTHEMAELLSLSPTTVRNYVAQLLAALHVHTRLQAVVAARRRGLIDV
jgi:PAS domain S-box-containing protein